MPSQPANPNHAPAPSPFAEDGSGVPVIAYVRVSTDTQAREGFGLDAQRAEIEAFCTAKGWDVLAWYEDAGVSGAAVDSDSLTVEREGLTSLLAEAPALGARYVVVANTSRLWRSDMVKVLVQRELKRQGLDVRSAQQPTYTVHHVEPTDFLVNGMMELLDAYERLSIAMKLKRGRLTKAKKGGFAGGQRPLGYRSAPEAADLQIEEREAEIVRRIWLRREEGAKLREIAAELNADRVPTKRGGRWHASTVRYVLKNPLYAGELRYGNVSAKRPDLRVVA